MRFKFLDRNIFWLILASVTFTSSLFITYFFSSPSLGLVGNMFTWIAGVINTIGILGIFLIMVLEYIIAPIPSELVLPFSGWLIAKGKFHFLPVILASTAASYFGSMLLYFIGAKGGRTFIEKYGKYFFLSEQHLESAENLFAKYGHFIIFAGRMLPGIRTIVSFPAGLVYMDKIKFSIYTIAGSLLWNCGLIGVGFLLGENWMKVSHIISHFEIPLLLTAVVILLWILYKKP